MDFSITLYDNLSFLWEIGLPFLVALTILVFVHEFGHYIVARWCGVRVEVFSIGFGKELKGWTDKNGTRWKIAAIPLGGYVKMFGDVELLENAVPLFETILIEFYAIDLYYTTYNLLKKHLFYENNLNCLNFGEISNYKDMKRSVF